MPTAHRRSDMRLVKTMRVRIVAALLLSVLSQSCVASVRDARFEKLQKFLEQPIFEHIELSLLSNNGGARKGDRVSERSSGPAMWLVKGWVRKDEDLRPLVSYLADHEMLESVRFEVMCRDAAGVLHAPDPRVFSFEAEKNYRDLETGYSVGHTSQVHGKRYVFKITNELMVNTHPHVLEEPTPLTIQEAVALATRSTHRYLSEADQENWRVTHVTLHRFGGSDRWYYTVAFRPSERVINAGVIEELRIPVLLNSHVVLGTVEPGQSKEERN